ncbi:hypothetical protein [Flavobacterium sp. 3HN19-14]|uniref:hypothetical protein n=1 Tax=Flavobacterium sp. 3HN19-14 TaxID=3448133 RepID=UPI003EE20420
MNLAISSLIIFILVSPAIIARRVYYTKELSKNHISRNTLQEIFSAIFLSFIIHSTWILCVGIFGFKIDFVITLKLLLNPGDIKDYSDISNNVGQISLYFILLTLFSAIISFIIRNYIRSKKIDRKNKFYQYDNTWYYLFSGEVLDIKSYNEGTITSEDVSYQFADVLVKSDESILYSGRIAGYQLNNDNSVDFIVLAEPKKENRNFEIKSKVKNEIKDLDGYLVIPYTDILNINLRYILH